MIGNFSRPVSSLANIIDAAVFRDESDVSMIGKYELHGKTFPFSSFPSKGELVVEVGGVRHSFSEGLNTLNIYSELYVCV